MNGWKIENKRRVKGRKKHEKGAKETESDNESNKKNK